MRATTVWTNLINDKLFKITTITLHPDSIIPQTVNLPDQQSRFWAKTFLLYFLMWALLWIVNNDDTRIERTLLTREQPTQLQSENWCTVQTKFSHSLAQSGIQKFYLSTNKEFWPNSCIIVQVEAIFSQKYLVAIKACLKEDYKTTLKFFKVIKSLMFRTVHNTLYQHQRWTMVFTSTLW